ncbi:MADS-box transcription factor 51-like [Rhodamnia argentea]|uniref:MADS-box transcription factor 51-like n=1 Tax=Rhodamnia argentea TaxID=178133 RepID=A0A8B8QRU6_9MYRT|nr:MADS-box transcription factor 51-like [Rhodamnia argentea]
MAKRRRTEIAKIADPAARLVTYSKRRKGLFKKASELCHLCGARAAVIVFSPAGKPCSFGDPSAEEVISEYIRGGHDDVVPLMGLTELEDWIEKEWNSCAAKEEDLESLIGKYERVRELLLKSLEDREKNSSAPANTGGDSAAGLGSNSENLSHQEIDPDTSLRLGIGDGAHGGFSTLPESSAIGGGSARVDSNPTCSHLRGCNSDPDTCLRLSRDWP